MRRWQTFSLFALLELVCAKKCYLKIWHLLFVPHCTYTNREGDNLFLPFCTIGISKYQKSTVPYTLFLTYLPQAYSPLERSRLTDWRRNFLFTPCSLILFFSHWAHGALPAGATLLGWPNWGVDGQLNKLQKEKNRLFFVQHSTCEKIAKILSSFVQ